MTALTPAQTVRENNRRLSLLWLEFRRVIPEIPPVGLTAHFFGPTTSLRLCWDDPATKDDRWVRCAEVQWRPIDGEALHVDLHMGDRVARFTATDPAVALDRAYAFVSADDASTEGLTPYLRGGPRPHRPSR